MASIPETNPTNTSSESYETVTLLVQIPADVAVGSTINVLYENNYFQIVVPENGPGNSVQVVLPATLAAAATTNDTAYYSDPTIMVDGDKNPQKHSRAAMGAAVGAAVVSAVFIGPFLTGAVIVGGAAVYVVSKRRHDQEEPRDPDSMLGKASSAIKGIDAKYAISATATKVVATTVTKAKELDEKTHFTETVSSISSSVATTVKATDDKYKISEKTGEAVRGTVDAVKNFDETHKISATASATAQTAAIKAKEFDSKYEISSSIGKAWTSALTKLTGNQQPPVAQPVSDEMEGQG